MTKTSNQDFSSIVDEVLNTLQESTIIIDVQGSVLGPEEDARAFAATKAQAKQTLLDAVMELTEAVIGIPETLENEKEWYEKTKPYGGTHEEYHRLKSIVNNYNNLKDEQRTRRNTLLGKEEK